MNWQTLPEGIVSWIGKVCVLAHVLNVAKAGASSATPLHCAPKSVTIFFAINDGVGEGDGDGDADGEVDDVGGAELAATLPPIELLPPGLYTCPPLVAIHPEPFPVTVEPASWRRAFDPCA